MTAVASCLSRSLLARADAKKLGARAGERLGVTATVQNVNPGRDTHRDKRRTIQTNNGKRSHQTRSRHTNARRTATHPAGRQPPVLSRTTVSSTRPENGDVRPGFRDAPAISQRNGVRGCPLARRKGNVVSYTLLQKRRSQKQRPQRRSASRALCWTHEKAARLFVAARVITQH